MATRRVQVVAVWSCTVLLASAACSQTNRYRMLNFFFDGVPDPSKAAQADGARDPSLAGQGEEAAGGASEPKPRVVSYPHPPYRDNRCGACHDVTTGGLFRSPQEGLCESCHGDVPGKVRYVHGPVAVSDCLFCHHPHTSTIPKLLLHKPADLCLQCHDRDDLTTGTHHDETDESSCTDCHGAHGGDHPFFLKRVEP